MSDVDDARESFTDDTSTYSVDDEDQLQPGDTLVDRGLVDVLDEGYSPPDYQPSSLDSDFRDHDETIEDRIRQEVPDPDSAYGAPDNESGLDEQEEDRVGGDDPDSIAAEDDWLGDAEVGDVRSGRLVAPDEGAHEDDEKSMVATDVGIDGAGASAEEAAMHVIRAGSDDR